jgi:hypothetical protein
MDGDAGAECVRIAHFLVDQSIADGRLGVIAVDVELEVSRDAEGVHGRDVDRGAGRVVADVAAETEQAVADEVRDEGEWVVGLVRRAVDDVTLGAGQGHLDLQGVDGRRCDRDRPRGVDLGAVVDLGRDRRIEVADDDGHGGGFRSLLGRS